MSSTNNYLQIKRNLHFTVSAIRILHRKFISYRNNPKLVLDLQRKYISLSAYIYCNFNINVLRVIICSSSTTKLSL